MLLAIVFLLAFGVGLAALVVAVLLGESRVTAVEWGAKSAVCVATLGLAVVTLILLHT